MKNLYLILLTSLISISALAQDDGYDEVDFYFDSLYAVKYKVYKAEKDSLALLNAYEKLNILSENPLGIKELYIKNPTIDTLPFLSGFTHVETVILEGCYNIDLENTFDKLTELPNLKQLSIIRSKQYSIPTNIGLLKNLNELNLTGNKFVLLPEEIAFISGLKSINVSNNRYLNETMFFELLQQKKMPWQNVIADKCQIREIPKEEYVIDNLSLEGNLLSSLPSGLQVNTLSLSSNQGLDLANLFENLVDAKLEELDLSYCKIEELPANIGGLISLKTLYLQGNHLMSIPSQIVDLQDLESLNLGNESEYKFTNKIESLPSSMGDLISLRHLDLSGNQIKKLPASFADLQQLSFLDLTWNKLSYFPKEVTALSKLQHLNLSFNPVKTIPESIGDLTNLNYLNLSGDFFFHYTTKIKTIPNSIGDLTSLETLILKDNVIEVLPESIGDLSKLKTLDLADNLFSNLPESIGDLSKLETLDLAANEITALPITFGQLSNLEYLDLRLNYKMDTDVISKKIATIKSLKFLDISECYLTKTAMAFLQKELPNTKIKTAMAEQ